MRRTYELANGPSILKAFSLLVFEYICNYVVSNLLILIQ